MRGSHEPTIKTPENKQQFIGVKMAKNPIDRTLFEVEGRKCFVHMFDGRTIKGKVSAPRRGFPRYLLRVRSHLWLYMRPQLVTVQKIRPSF